MGTNREELQIEPRNTGDRVQTGVSSSHCVYGSAIHSIITAMARNRIAMAIFVVRTCFFAYAASLFAPVPAYAATVTRISGRMNAALYRSSIWNALKLNPDSMIAAMTGR